VALGLELIVAPEKRLELPASRSSSDRIHKSLPRNRQFVQIRCRLSMLTKGIMALAPQLTLSQRLEV
jgi:hypothetical protein